MDELIEMNGMGWLPDYPDFRDYTFEQDSVGSKLKDRGQKDSIKAMRRKVGITERKTASRTVRGGQMGAPGTGGGQSSTGARLGPVDLRQWCSPIENQGSIGSCTAHAGVGVVEYYERRAFGKHMDASRLFLYKVTRNMLHSTGDTGAFLRTTMGALTLFGVPPEEYLQYNIADFEKEPSAFCYAFAQNYQAITYYRLDPSGTPKDVLLTRVKTDLAAGLPPMFGFTCYSSISQAATNGGKIPFPTSAEKIVGGHAIMAVGYDDSMKIKNSIPGAVGTTGALLIRNSWGTGWGSGGYGWLPYEYVLRGLAIDWWSLLKNEWVDTGAFKA